MPNLIRRINQTSETRRFDIFQNIKLRELSFQKSKGY